MTSQIPQLPNVPTTPLRIFVRNPGVPQGPFYVVPEHLAKGEEMGDITDEEIDALAQIIYSTYLEWKQQ